MLKLFIVILYFEYFVYHVSIYSNSANCRAQVISRVEYETGTGTWLICVVCCLVGCDLGCCLIPFCVDSMKDATHYCPNCNVSVGQRKLL